MDQFRAAAEEARDPEVKLQLATYQLHRSRFITEMQGFVLGLGQELENAERPASPPKRKENRESEADRPEYEIFADCEAAEEQIARECDRLLASRELPGYIREVVERQCQEVHEAPESLRLLGKAFGLQPAF